MAALPILKLFFLGVKQLSKPVAGFIKNRAKNSPAFKEHVINAAQLWHRVNVRASQAASNASAEARALRIKPLDEATAVSTFTDILEKDAKKAAALELRFKNAEAELDKQRKESEALRDELKCSQQNLFHISQDMMEILQGHRFSDEAVAVRRARLAAYAASVDGFSEEVATRAAASPALEAHRAPFSDRWLKRIQSMLNSKE